ncbi:hypothetical protein QWA68_014657 [Fusarium oxysporum]|nr:hypothetical protein QWA68_014657 [Fusarium oxysporum]
MATNGSQFLAEPVAPPKINIPTSKETVQVRVINQEIGLAFSMPPDTFFSPATPGFTDLSMPIFAFVISHGDHHIMFDAGIRRDWQSLSPAVVGMLTKMAAFPPIEQDVLDILESDTSGLGIGLEDIEALIWSHHHFDHTGDPSRFPSSTKLVVGPELKEMLSAGYPANKDAMILDSDAAGREVASVDFSQGLQIGGFAAHDYFGDGSFYLLHAPGHTPGHMCALARTTYDEASGESTFVFLGADACHHPGVLRPNEYLPLPCSINPSPFPSQRATHTVCPGHTLQGLLMHKQPNKPVFELKEGPMFWDIILSQQTVRGMQKLDVNTRIFIILAHDKSLVGNMPMFPKTVNNWFEEGVGEETRWRFFQDCESVVLNKSS